MRNLLLSTVTFLVVPAVAIAAPDFSSHTHTTPIELKPISSSSGPKLAGICFLGYGECGDGGFNSMGEDGGYIVDTIKQCTNEGFVKSCSSGYCMDKSCPYNSAYGKCIKENCPTNSSPTCTGAVVGKTACGGNCKQCCSDSCPSGSKDYTGSYASTTECGNKCFYCNTSCPSGTSTSYSGSISSYNECGIACKKCSTSCPSGTTTTNPGGCGGSTRNECNTKTCYYPFQACCDNSCYGDTPRDCPDGYYESRSSDGCGNTCYQCAKTYCAAEIYSSSSDCYCSGSSLYATEHWYSCNPEGECPRETNTHTWRNASYSSAAECQAALSSCSGSDRAGCAFLTTHYR